MTEVENSLGNSDGVTCVRAGRGYFTFHVEDYSTFLHQVAPKFVNVCLKSPLDPIVRKKHHFVWRGMRDPSWPLQPSLSRAASSALSSKRINWRKDVARLTTDALFSYMNHLRGLHLLTPQHGVLHTFLKEHVNKRYMSFDTVLERMTPEMRNLTHELFSLGQHYEMYTPFLDWTTVPAIALWFAFSGVDQPSENSGMGHRVVFALNQTIVEELCPPTEPSTREGIRFMTSMAHDNSRIVGQAGLFTFVPAHMSVDQWVVKNCEDPDLADKPVLLRFLIRNVDRDKCLNELAALNIHNRTVFPDTLGAAKHTNFDFERQARPI